jgi:hypothetical protein
VIYTQKDKQSFDRWIATVFALSPDGTISTNVASVLIAENLAVPYMG